MTGTMPRRLADAAPEFHAVLSGERVPRAVHPPDSIIRDTVLVPMRDGVRLATDLYLPPVTPAPAIAARTPYGRATLSPLYEALAGAGYAVVSQDCRGTGDSEPDHWEFYVFEREDSLDFVSWVTGQALARRLPRLAGRLVRRRHPVVHGDAPDGMTAIAPEVAGLGLAPQAGRPLPHVRQRLREERSAMALTRCPSTWSRWSAGCCPRRSRPGTSTTRCGRRSPAPLPSVTRELALAAGRAGQGGALARTTAPAAATSGRSIIRLGLGRRRHHDHRDSSGWTWCSRGRARRRAHAAGRQRSRALRRCHGARVHDHRMVRLVPGRHAAHLGAAGGARPARGARAQQAADHAVGAPGARLSRGPRSPSRARPDLA